MASGHYFDNVSVGGFISSDESGNDGSPSLLRGGNTVFGDFGYPTHDFSDFEHVFLTQDVGGLCIDESSAEDGVLRINTGEERAASSGGVKTVDDAAGVNDVVIDQLSPVVDLEAELAGSAEGSGPEKTSGNNNNIYVTMKPMGEDGLAKEMEEGELETDGPGCDDVPSWRRERGTKIVERDGVLVEVNSDCDEYVTCNLGSLPNQPPPKCVGAVPDVVLVQPKGLQGEKSCRSSNRKTYSQPARKVVTDQIPRMVRLLRSADEMNAGGVFEMPSDDSGYESMSLDDRDAEKTKDVRTCIAMDVDEKDGEAPSTSGFKNINIYCVCCSQKVESPVNLQNRLCKQCIAIMVDDSSCNVILNTVKVPCAICSKRFEKNRKERNQLCGECTTIVLHGYEYDIGVNKTIVGCCVCHRPFTKPLHASNVTAEICPQCEYIMNAPEIVTCGVEEMVKENNPRWADNVVLQGYTAITVKTQLRKHFYKWCDGHRNGDAAQEAHQCLEKSYAEQTLRRICYTMCPNVVVKMIQSMQLDDGLKLGKGAERVVNNALWAIYLAPNPFLKMKQFKRGCPVCVRAGIERAVTRWGDRLCPIRYREQFKPLRRKLSYSNCS